jgi:hypothetical protein
MIIREKETNAVKIYFINNTGGGFSGETEIEEGTTIVDFFKSQFPEKSFSDYGITVNKLDVPQSRVLVENDTVTIVPGKYSGA